MFYNGDGTPAFATGETADTVAFYRRSANVNEVVFSYPNNSNNVAFRGVISGNGSGLTNLTLANVTGLQTALDGKVSLAGDQSVAGVKTFSTALAVTGTSKAAGRFYGGTTDPTNTTRLNYDGYFYATRFYGDASQLSVATTGANGVMSAADKAKLDSLSAASGISEDDAIVLALIFG